MPDSGTTSTSPVPRAGSRPDRLTLPAAMHRGQQIASLHGLRVSHHRLSRLIRGYVGTGQPAANFDAWLYSTLTYSDPVGETVVARMTRGTR